MTDPAQATPEQCPNCGTKLKNVPGIGPSCLKKGCPVLDGWAIWPNKPVVHNKIVTVESLQKIIAEKDQQQAELLAHAEAMAGALEKLSPISVQMGADYADVYFADGSTHRTQAMTMNPQDWLDLEASFSAFRAYQKGHSDA